MCKIWIGLQYIILLDEVIVWLILYVFEFPDSFGLNASLPLMSFLAVTLVEICVVAGFLKQLDTEEQNILQNSIAMVETVERLI